MYWLVFNFIVSNNNVQTRTLEPHSSNAYVKGNHQQVLRGVKSRHIL